MYDKIQNTAVVIEDPPFLQAWLVSSCGELSSNWHPEEYYTQRTVDHRCLLCAFLGHDLQGHKVLARLVAGPSVALEAEMLSQCWEWSAASLGLTSFPNSISTDSLGSEATPFAFCEDHLGFKEDACLYLPAHFQEGAASLSLWWENSFQFSACFAAWFTPCRGSVSDSWWKILVSMESNPISSPCSLCFRPAVLSWSLLAKVYLSLESFWVPRKLLKNWLRLSTVRFMGCAGTHEVTHLPNFPFQLSMHDVW